MHNLLRMAGQKIRAFDDAYAGKVSDLIESKVKNSNLKFGLQAGSATPITYRPGMEDIGSAKEMMLALGVLGGTYGANFASRYALPAGAAVLGLKGAADITAGLYNAASDMPLLPQDQSNTYV